MRLAFVMGVLFIDDDGEVSPGYRKGYPEYRMGRVGYG